MKSIASLAAEGNASKKRKKTDGELSKQGVADH